MNLMEGDFELPPCSAAGVDFSPVRPTPGTLPEGGFTFDPAGTRFKRLRRKLAAACNEVQDWVDMLSRYRGRPTHRRLFTTLTYAENTRGNADDIKGTMRCLREWLRRCGHRMVPYAWVAELQERGALHYHLVIWLPRALYLPKLDRRGWWKHGSTKVETARNPTGYLVKYASKLQTKDGKRLRKGTRLHGTGGLPPEAREKVRRVMMTRWARTATDAVLDAEFDEMIEREIREQEREEENALECFLGEEYVPPDWLLEEREHAAFEDPDAAREEYEAQLLEQWERQEALDALRKRGGSRFARCVGGFLDRLTGALLPTPWRVEFFCGGLMVWPKEAV